MISTSKFFGLLTVAWLSAAMSAALAAEELAVPTALTEFMQQQDDVFQWRHVQTRETDSGRVLELRLTSQRWQGIVWEHAVEIFEPKTVQLPKQALLFITGGRQPPASPRPQDLVLGLRLAQLSGMRVVMLHQVPNQPLLGDRVEDDLITETWLKYLATGDTTWPLLFPMVKSVVRAMDAVQELSAAEFEHRIESFVVTGASKRGWTSWLTPVADSRVIGIAPIVIDVLNFRAQMQHQLDSWGRFSDQIRDYSSKGLIVLDEETDRERQLRLMMDPYTYRHQLQLPKLLVNGTNDPYWVVDATQKYWNDLQGPKYALQVPNAGHSLDAGRDQALTTVACFARMVAAGTPLPQLTWTFSSAGTARTLSVTSSQPVRQASLWFAESRDLDFRDEQWDAIPMQPNADGWTAERSSPRHMAVYAELTYTVADTPYSLSTIIYRD